MTHGCLLIRSRGSRYNLWLHTFHTATLIPRVVEEALPRRALRRYSFLSETLDRDTSQNRLREELEALAYTDGAGFPPSAAAWIIAARPDFLEPTPEPFHQDLADWAGLDDPYVLTISESLWKLKGPEGKSLLSINVRETMLGAVEQFLSGLSQREERQ